MKNLLLHVMAHILVPGSMLFLLILPSVFSKLPYDPFVWEWPLLIALGGIALSYTSKKFLDRYLIAAAALLFLGLLGLPVWQHYDPHWLADLALIHVTADSFGKLFCLMFTPAAMGVFASGAEKVYWIASRLQKMPAVENS